MALKDQILDGGTWRDSAVKSTNTSGSPVVSAVSNGDGRALADVYILTFSGVTPTDSGTVTVSSSSPNNPYNGKTFTVALDGTTLYRNVIPGISLVFSNNGGFSNAWTATVNIGEFLGVFDAFGGGAGVPSAGARHRVFNNGTGAVSAAKATLLSIAKWVKKTGLVFASVRNFAEGAVEKQAGGGSSRIVPYVFAVSNVTGSGSAKTCSVSVDGAVIASNALRDLSTGATQNGNLVKALNPGYFYRVVTGDLTGLEFAIEANVSNGDTANVLIFNSRFVQIAPDVSGSAGTYGTADLPLTESGQAAGVISPNGVAYYWRRILVPAGANAESNPYPGDVALKATETGAAGWEV